MAQQAALLKDDLLDPDDQLLEDAALVDLVGQCLSARRPLSTRTGRDGIAPDRRLRCFVMKHLQGWGFRDLERSSAATSSTAASPTSMPRPRPITLPSTVPFLCSVQRSPQPFITAGGQLGLRARRRPKPNDAHRHHVESNVHYPTDSSLLGDGIRVLSRSLQRFAGEWKKGALEVGNHGRAVQHRLLEISRAAKCLTQTNQQRMQNSYEKLVALTRRVVRQAGDVVQPWAKGGLKVVGKLLRVETQMDQLKHFLPLVEKVIRQTKQRVWGGNTQVEDKVLSLFEPHTAVIRKGKAHKPNEFGRLVRIDEVEKGIVSGYQVLLGNPPDTTAWMSALQQHQAGFGRAPEMATADRGFFSAQNEREAEALGVKKVALPGRGRLSARRAQHQKHRWFRRTLRWLAGCEASISTLKHPFSMERAIYKGEHGFQRYVAGV